jgi:nucleotide-binding universal stress UspA family protein
MQGMSIRRIFVALGSSPPNAGPLPAAIALAQRLPMSELVLFHAWLRRSPLLCWPGLRSRRESTPHRVEMLENLRAHAGRVPPYISATVVTRNGGAWPAIDPVAKEHGADLIVMGAPAPSAATSLLRTNAERLAQDSEIPVLTVPRQTPITDDGGFRRILVPVDFSPESTLALDYASRLARSISASVRVVHAWRSPTWFGVELGKLDVRLSREKISMRDFAMERATVQLASSTRALGAPVDGRIAEGDPSSIILAEAKTADLIVLGCHRAPSPSSALRRGVVSHVVRHAPCPVMTICRREPIGVPPRDGRMPETSVTYRIVT